MGEPSNYYLKITNENSSVNNNNYNVYRRLNDMKATENDSSLSVTLSANDTYYFDKEKKEYLKSSTPILENINEYFPLTKYFSNFTDNEQSAIEQVKLALKSSIKTTDFRDTNCYAISINWKDSGIKNTTILYISKDNLTLIASELLQENQKDTTTYEVELNTQTEANFSVENMLTEYTQVN